MRWISLTDSSSLTTRAGIAHADFNPERFATTFIEQVECSIAASAVENVVHEVQRPDPVVA
jgi:hypothetical protein